MRTSVKIAIAAAILVTALIGVATGCFGFMGWALALNGFMGQERAVNTSMSVFVVSAVAVVAMASILSGVLVYFTAHRRNWNAGGSAVVAITIFGILSGVLHIACVIVAAVVADAMRTTR